MSSKSLEDEPMTKPRLTPWAIVSSMLLHGVAYASLGAAEPRTSAAPHQTQLRFDVVSSPKPPEPKPEPPKPPPPAKPRRAAEPPPRSEPVAAPPTPPATPEPPDPSEGTTLVGDARGDALSVPLGNGGALDSTARSRAPAPVNAPAPTRPLPPPVPAAPRLVAVSDLSSRPSPPSLAAALERNYPADARRRGLSGAAKVRARIDPDGVVRRVSLIEESGSGFGTACSRALTGSRWAAPKDKAGRPVATEIRYTCRFVVEP
jgi:protein TonB